MVVMVTSGLVGTLGESCRDAGGSGYVLWTIGKLSGLMSIVTATTVKLKAVSGVITLTSSSVPLVTLSGVSLPGLVTGT